MKSKPQEPGLIRPLSPPPPLHPTPWRSARTAVVLLTSALLLALIPTPTLTLSPGPHPPYDVLCLSNASAVPSPWDCEGYIRCEEGRVSTGGGAGATGVGGSGYHAVWTLCDSGKLYDPVSATCSGDYSGCPTPQVVAENYCTEFPSLVFTHPDSCALFYRCLPALASTRGGLQTWEAECPYPQLFNPATLSCVPRPSDDVKTFCGSRPVPATPCDYRVGCTPAKHCQGQADGSHADVDRPFSQHYAICHNEQVVRETKCEKAGQIFDPTLQQCMFGIRDGSVSAFCDMYPTAVFPDPYHCARHFNCSQLTWHTNLRARQSECPYPSLFDATIMTCTGFDDVSCGTREEPIQPCDYIMGHCQGRDQCLPCQASCLGLPDGYNAYPGYVLTPYHSLCHSGRTLDIRNCTTGLVFDPQLRACSPDISIQTLDLFCSENPHGKLPHPSECSLLYDCTRLTAEPNFSKYLSECKYPYLVDASTVQCKPHDQVVCGDRREPISPCDYLGYKCRASHCKSCELVMPSCYGKLNGYYPINNQEMTSTYMECRDQRVVALSSCSGGLIFDIVHRKCTDVVSKVSMLRFCTNFLMGRVQNPQNCGQYYDCTHNMTEVQECRYPDLYHVTSQHCRHYKEVDCTGRPAFLNPCDSFTFCSVAPCPYCPGAFPSCQGRNGVIAGFVFDSSLYYRCMDDRMILGRCANRFDRSANGCVGSVATPPPVTTTTTTTTAVTTPAATTTTTPTATTATTPTPTTTTTATPTTTTTTTTTAPSTTTTSLSSTTTATEMPTTTTKATTTTTTTATTTTTTTTQPPFPLPSDVNTTCLKDPGFIVPKGDNCAQFYNCSQTRDTTLGYHVSECPIGQLFHASTGLCAPRHLVQCEGRPAPLQACHYKASHRCPFSANSDTTSVCRPCRERFPTCWGSRNGPRAFPRHLSAFYVTCYRGRVTGVQSCPSGQFLDPLSLRCSAQLSRNTTLYFCRRQPHTLLPHPLHCARYIHCQRLGVQPLEGECPYPQLVAPNGQCQPFATVQCGARYEPKYPCEYAALRKCPDKSPSGCASCNDRYPSCRGQPDSNRPYPGRLMSPWFIKCRSERTLAIVRCVHSLFDPVTNECGHSLDHIIQGVASNPVAFCRSYPDAVVADPAHCARFYNCSDITGSGGRGHYNDAATAASATGLLGRPYLTECRFPSLFDRHTGHCDSFLKVLRAPGGCGTSLEPVHQCQYSSYCPGTRYRTCRDCYSQVPNCRGLPDGIHTVPPGRRFSQSFVYCLAQRALVFSHCPPGSLYYRTAKTCVARNSVQTNPSFILISVNESPEI